LRARPPLPTNYRRAAPGIGPGDFLPLTIDELRKGYTALLAALKRPAPAGPDNPPLYHDAITGEIARMEDTQLHRAWYVTAQTIDDDDRRISLLKRLEMATPFLNDRKYAKYVSPGAMHIALLATVARLPFSIRTTKKALRAAFDAEFKRQLTATVDLNGPCKPS